MGRTIQVSGMNGISDRHEPDLLRYKIPASFMGSLAWASDQVADALTLTRELGKLSFFLAMTCNPAWPEISVRLLPRQHFTEIPAVICRAFHIRLQCLKEFIKSHFGRIIYEITVVEFQKRGLPHCHMVFKVRPLPFPNLYLLGSLKHSQTRMITAHFK